MTRRVLSRWFPGLWLDRLRRKGYRSVVLISHVNDGGKVTDAQLVSDGFDAVADLRMTYRVPFVRIRGVVKRLLNNVWSRVATGRSALHEVHVHSRVRVDAALRSYVGTTTQSNVRFTRRTYGRVTCAAPLAMRAVDPDHDGVDDLLVLCPDSVRWFAIGQAGFVQRGSTPLSASAASTVPRRPIGTLVSGSRDTQLFVRVSGLEQGMLLVWQSDTWVKRSMFSGYPVSLPGVNSNTGFKVGLAELVDYTDQLGLVASDSPNRIQTLESSSPTKVVSAAFPTAMPRLFYRAKRARSAMGYAVVDQGGVIHVYRTKWSTPVGVVGRAFELIDLDRNGSLELIATSAKEDGGDQVSVYSLRDTKKSQLLWKSGWLKGNVPVLAAGSFESAGHLDLVGCVCRNNSCTFERFN